MPSRPPETPFYENPEHETLWRDISRRYEDFAGPNESRWSERGRSFLRVQTDIQLRLDPMPCNICDGSLENIALDHGVKLKCPKCGWEPVTVEQGVAI